MEITLTLERYVVLKKLLSIVVEAISQSAPDGEATSDSDKVEWSATEVKFTIS